jgi:hypothetical protein
MSVFSEASLCINVIQSALERVYTALLGFRNALAYYIWRIYGYRGYR